MEKFSRQNYISPASTRVRREPSIQLHCKWGGFVCASLFSDSFVDYNLLVVTNVGLIASKWSVVKWTPLLLQPKRIFCDIAAIIQVWFCGDIGGWTAFTWKYWTNPNWNKISIYDDELYFIFQILLNKSSICFFIKPFISLSFDHKCDNRQKRWKSFCRMTILLHTYFLNLPRSRGNNLHFYEATVLLKLFL